MNRGERLVLENSIAMERRRGDKAAKAGDKLRAQIHYDNAAELGRQLVRELARVVQ